MKIVIILFTFYSVNKKETKKKLKQSYIKLKET